MIFLETVRTTIRAFTKGDIGSLEKIMTDPEVMKYTGFKNPQSLEEIEKNLLKWSAEGKGPLGVWCVVEKITDEFVGWFMLKNTGHLYPEIGFMLSKEKWGMGFATEVSKELISYALRDLGYKKVIAKTVSENQSSISVLKKIGMKELQIEALGDPDLLYFEISSLSP